jgi:hypothetical protein
MINSQYRKPLPGTTLDYFDTEAAIEALAPGSFRKLPIPQKCSLRTSLGGVIQACLTLR